MGQLTTVMIWWGIVAVVGLNGFAAGLAAMLYLWRRAMRRGPRVALAAVLSGLLPASIVIPMSFTDSDFSGGEVALRLALGFFTVLAVASVLSLPGAILVTRGLERPGDDYRVFE